MSKNLKALESLVAFLASTSGRDKSCRLLQYFGKFAKAFFSYIAARQHSTFFKQLSDKSDFLGTSMSMTRKVLRFGRPIGISYNVYKLLKAYQRSHSSKDQYDKTKNGAYVISKALADISLSLFFLFDHILYFSRINLMKNPKLKNKADYLSNLFWLGECIFTIIADCIEIHILQKQNNELSNENGLVKKADNIKDEIANKVDTCIMDILRSIIDIPIALHFMNEKFLTPGYAGILGVITSYIGCWQNWPVQTKIIILA